jgi:hypothetical protein
MDPNVTAMRPSDPEALVRTASWRKCVPLVGSGAGRERLTVRLDEQYAGDPGAARDALTAEVAELASAEAEGLLGFVVETVPREAFQRTATSGKLRTVIDLR